MAAASEAKRSRSKAGSRHADWMSLIEISGPFLSLPVLDRIFPQGLDAGDPDTRRDLRSRFSEWEAEQEKRRPDRAIHHALGPLGAGRGARLSACDARRGAIPAGRPRSAHHAGGRDAQARPGASRSRDQEARPADPDLRAGPEPRPCGRGQALEGRAGHTHGRAVARDGRAPGPGHQR